jgi:hypothetical protein
MRDSTPHIESLGRLTTGQNEAGLVIARLIECGGEANGGRQLRRVLALSPLQAQPSSGWRLPCALGRFS